MDRETLRRFRAEHGLTQRRLAELLGLSQATIGRWETGMAIEKPVVIDRALRDLDRELRAEESSPATIPPQCKNTCIAVIAGDGGNPPS